MFDSPPQPKTQQDFPKRLWIGVSCANPACPNYANRDVFYPKAGKSKDRQRYKCKQCQKPFLRLEPPAGLFQLNRASDNEEVEVKTEENLEVNQPERQPLQRKRVSFLLTYEAVQGLQDVCNSLGIDSSELLEQLGQGWIEVRRVHRKAIELNPTFRQALRTIKSRDS